MTIGILRQNDKQEKTNKISSNLTLQKGTTRFTFSSRWSSGSSSSSSSATAAKAVPSTPKISHEELITNSTEVFRVVGKRRVIDDSDGCIGGVSDLAGLCLFVAHSCVLLFVCLLFSWVFRSCYCCLNVKLVLTDRRRGDFIDTQGDLAETRDLFRSTKNIDTQFKLMNEKRQQ